MKCIRMVVIASLIGFSLGAAYAQSGGGKAPGSAPGPMGAGPDARTPGMGMGNGAGRGGAQWGSDFTPGWTLMSQQERNEHRERMRSMKSYEECNAYQVRHHEQMAARAKESGGATLAQPRRDACAGLKK